MGDESYEKIKKMLSEGKTEEAESALNALIEKSENSLEQFPARFLRARYYEGGVFGFKSFEKARYDYLFLYDQTGSVKSQGALGLARLLFKENDKSNFDNIIDYCNQSIKINANVKAMILMGAAYQHLRGDSDLAATYYLKALKKGSKWGIYYYTLLKKQDKKYTIYLSFRIFLAIIFPLLSMFDKSKYPIM